MPHPTAIVFICPWFGHVPAQMAHIWEPLTSGGCSIINVTDNAGAAEAFTDGLNSIDSSMVSHVQMDKPIPAVGVKHAGLADAVAYWDALGATLQNTFAEMDDIPGIFHIWADLHSHDFLPRRVVAAAVPWPWVALCIHPVEFRLNKSMKRRSLEALQNIVRYGRPRASRVRPLLTPTLKRLYMLDEGIVTQANRAMHTDLVYPFPEATTTEVTPLSLPRMVVDGKRKPIVVGVVGFLEKRKGYLKLMRVARRLEGTMAFLFAGAIRREELTETEAREVDAFCEAPPAHTLLHLERMSDDAHVNAAVQACDILYIGYDDFFHSSNIQIKAALFEKPVISCTKHLIAERTRKYQLGWCLEGYTEEDILRLLETIDHAELERVRAAARFSDFTASHTPEKLAKAVSEARALLNGGTGYA